jgi:hypothetical protein
MEVSFNLMKLKLDMVYKDLPLYGDYSSVPR